MKLEEGKSVYIGGKKFVGEIPDELAKKFGLLKKTATTLKPKVDK